jgi:photosystem II PsbJ protein
VSRQEIKIVSNSGRIPLWIVATVAGMGVIAVVGLFFYGAYAGLGSSM